VPTTRPPSCVRLADTSTAAAHHSYKHAQTCSLLGLTIELQSTTSSTSLCMQNSCKATWRTWLCNKDKSQSPTLVSKSKKNKNSVKNYEVPMQALQEMRDANHLVQLMVDRFADERETLASKRVIARLHWTNNYTWDAGVSRKQSVTALTWWSVAQSVPQPGSNDWKCSVVDDLKMGVSNDHQPCGSPCRWQCPSALQS